MTFSEGYEDAENRRTMVHTYTFSADIPDLRTNQSSSSGNFNTNTCTEKYGDIQMAGKRGVQCNRTAHQSGVAAGIQLQCG